MSMFLVRSGYGDAQQEMIWRKLAQTGGLPKSCRPATLVGATMAGLLASGVSVAGSAVPVSIEGGQFRLSAEVSTEVISDSAKKQVEVGTTAEGIPVVITRLSYRKVPLGGDEENGEVVSPDRGGELSDGASVSTDGNGVVAGDASTGMSTKTPPVKGEVVPFLMHAVTPRSVSIAWGGDASVVYNVYRDGQLLAQVSDGKYIDETVNPGSEYQYSIEAVTAMVDSSARLSMSGAVHVRTLDEGASFEGGFARVTKAVRRGGPTATLYKRRTFIKDDRVKTGALENLGCRSLPWQKVEYKGDNRDWSNEFYLDPNRSRTEVSVAVDWTRTPARIDKRIHVSRTVRYIDDDKAEAETAAPNESWYLDEASDSDGSYAFATLNHNIGNPFCGLGSIRYRENVHMWNDGSVFVEGWRRRAPHHEAIAALEFVGGRGFRSWPIIRRENNGFHCLVPGACFIDYYQTPRP